ncbi:Phosphoribosyl transferase domain-containing protein [Azotobacter beijerinckii]|uniref:Phosphoribosyl transferase domain-containing protein n=1 Tax=Azotobacter beijerinckii TaxID=170623 RepID=A0A1H6R0B6_9GAMM|nr:phosphoribosyltransferase family protein [Azotobacter beijerinckii]SEI46684.1 Phosphoribosyl transferase domain-containing protein [Azotobacter beijerinckii]
MNFISYANLAEDIRKNIHKLHDREIDLVVGIPRSGMIPAYMISLYLNVNCLDLASFCRNEKPAHGRTRRTANILTNAWDAKKILLVDDSIISGMSMRSAVEQLPGAFMGKLLKMAVYSASAKPAEIDIYFEHVACPRIFEWNIYHHRILSHACIDIDGVLCAPPIKDQNEDDEKYTDLLTNAKPLNLPSYKIHSLISSRPEKYRKETEVWLRAHNIKYEHLIMRDLPDSKYCHPRTHAMHKAEYYSTSRLDLFLESDPGQALEIAKATGKPVFCATNHRLYQSGALQSIYTTPSLWVFRNIYKKLTQSLSLTARRH